MVLVGEICKVDCKGIMKDFSIYININRKIVCLLYLILLLYGND